MNEKYGLENVFDCYCIYGEQKENIDIYEDDIICEGCRILIQENRY